MEYHFYKKLETAKILELIRNFFEKNGFQVSVNSDGFSSHTITARALSRNSLLSRIIVKVCEKKDFLSVNFLESDKLHSKMLLGSFLGLFGGNLFLLKNMEIKEKMDKLEEAFWKYLELNL